ncbi:MAG: hypothetical protein AAGF77_06935 [Bacteroidota bacterium]
MINKHNSLIPIVILLTSLWGIQQIAAQDGPDKLLFKDGTTKIGHVKYHPGRTKVRFRKHKKGELQFFDFREDLSRLIKNYGENDETIYEMKPIGKKQLPTVLKVKVEGYLSLYVKTTHGIGGGTMDGSGAFVMGNGYSITDGYVQKKGDSTLTHLSSTGLFGRRLKKSSVAYFRDCPTLVQKIENKVFTKTKLKEIVTYYNTECQ